MASLSPAVAESLKRLAGKADLPPRESGAVPPKLVRPKAAE